VDVPINETSSDSSAAAIGASNTAGGPALWASSGQGRAVVGVSETGVPIWGET
jgi:hypothetical protein